MIIPENIILAMQKISFLARDGLGFNRKHDLVGFYRNVSDLFIYDLIFPLGVCWILVAL